MTATTRVRLGRSGVEVTALGFGGATIGGLFRRIPEAQVQETLAAAFEAGIGLFDTAPLYGHGQSELRLGYQLRQRDLGDTVLATKVGRVLQRPRTRPREVDLGGWSGGLPFEWRWDLSYDGIMRSYEDSLQRFGINRVDLLTIHDLDYSEHATPEIADGYLDQLTREGGLRALEQLKAAGEIRGIGAGVNDPGTITRFAERFALDYFLLAMPYSLVEQEMLDGELSYCSEHDIGIIKGAPYASGILATGAVPGATYNYRAAAPAVRAKVASIAAVCDRHGVPLRAAALQFALAHPAVATVIPGAVTPAEVRDNVAMVAWPIAGDLWLELRHEGLLRADAPTPETVSAVESVCAVVGAGAMGHGIAEVLARTQPVVWLYDPDPAALERAVALVHESLERLARHGLVEAQVALETPSRLRTTTDLGRAVERAWLVVEAAPEDLAVKQELFAELDRLAPPDALLATNSSSFTIAQVAAHVGPQRRSRIVGSHFFLPAQIVPLVEVSRGKETADEAVERVCSLWERCGKEPVRVRRDVPGYIANRLQRALMREALAQVAEGLASAEDIDRAVRFGFGLRFLVRGPLAQRDVAGLDLAARVQVDVEDHERLAAGRRYLLELAAAGHLGLKTGRGLLDWHGRDPEQVRRDGDEELARAAALLGEAPPVTDSSDPRSCSFCGKSAAAARHLIGAMIDPDVYICEDCVTVCKKVLEDEEDTASS